VSSDSLSLKYAQGFAIDYYADYKKVTVKNPWANNAVIRSYYLVNDSSTRTPADGVKIIIPVTKMAVTVVTIFEFLSLLDEIDCVNAVCQPQLIYNQDIRAKYKSSGLVDLGDSFSIDIETILHTKPNAILVSGYGSADIYTNRLEKTGIPVIINNEWMESTPLARSEWIKFIAAFFDKENLADSIFDLVANNYNSIKYGAKEIENKTTVMIGNDFRGTWYMPGGRNYMAALIADAGGNYFYENNTETGSLPLNYEKVIKNFSQSDVWLNCNFNSFDELLKVDKKNSYFRPFKLRQVYNFNKRKMPEGANDFWESAVARPDLLLNDIIAVLYPDNFPDYETVYIEKLK
jgi:iron complex transport system substrate-binding protein